MATIATSRDGANMGLLMQWIKTRAPKEQLFSLLANFGNAGKPPPRPAQK